MKHPCSNLNLPVRLSALLIFCLLGSFQPDQAVAQGLRPGFDRSEYLQMLSVTREQVYEDYHPSPANSISSDTTRSHPTRKSVIPLPKNCTMMYHAPESGLMNRWALWIRSDSVGIISIRGTVNQTESWMENFYAAMVPATGVLYLHPNQPFTYKLAENPRASVHVGWLIGMASMAPSIVHQIQLWHQKGIHEFIVFGHSQGGAIAFLLRSYLYYLPDTLMPKDIVIKTYCSAAPKPGNVYYAYDFDRITHGGWALRVVSDLDWVPESPLGVQTVQDFNAVNPFISIKPALRKMPLLTRLYAGHVYRQLNGSTEKANKKLRRYLGQRIFRIVHHYLPDLKEPPYAHSMNYVPAGQAVVLMPYPGFDQKFPDTSKNVFIYHGLEAYYSMVVHQFNP